MLSLPQSTAVRVSWVGRFRCVQEDGMCVHVCVSVRMLCPSLSVCALLLYLFATVCTDWILVLSSPGITTSPYVFFLLRSSSRAKPAFHEEEEKPVTRWFKSKVTRPPPPRSFFLLQPWIKNRLRPKTSVLLPHWCRIPTTVLVILQRPQITIRFHSNTFWDHTRNEPKRRNEPREQWQIGRYRGREKHSRETLNGFDAFRRRYVMFCTSLLLFELDCRTTGNTLITGGTQPRDHFLLLLSQ